MSTSFSDLYTYICVFAFLFLLLRLILIVATEKLKKPHPLPLDDEFVKEYGYSYEYTMVFHVYDEGELKLNQLQKNYSMKSVVDRLNNAGLQTRCFYSCQRDELYVKIRAPIDRLKQEAARIGYKLMLDQDKLRAKLNAGKKGSWKPIVVVDEKNFSPLSPYKFIYGPYMNFDDVQVLFQLYPGMENHKHIFKSVDRIKLLLSIFETKVTENGCGLNVRELQLNNVLLAAFPIHDYDDLKSLQKKWLILFSYPWETPIDGIRDYFGERIGFYFAYLSHYCTNLTFPALLGFITYICRVVYNTPEMFLMPIFSLYMLVWSSIYVEFWKRKQSTLAMQWGVVGFEDSEQDRPEFDGIKILSPVNGKETTYFPSGQQNTRVSIVVGITITCITGVISIVIGIFFVQYLLTLKAYSSYIIIIPLIGFNLTGFLVSISNAIVIIILNTVYRKAAVKLTKFENWRTDTEYEDNLVSKIFSFQLINSFAALTYVSFIKSFIGISCPDDSCVGDIATTLSTIFLSGVITRTLQEFLKNSLLQEIKFRRESSGLEPGITMSPLEQQYILSDYDVLLGTLMDFAVLTIQYGYTVLFVAAFPLAPTMAFMSSYIQLRVDGWRLCQACKRPQPKLAEDIGVWQDMIEILSILSLIYNFAIIFFTSHYLIDIRWEYRWIMYLILQHIVGGIKYFIAAIIDDIPGYVQLQLDRQAIFIEKVLYNVEDEAEDEYVAGAEKTNVMIADTDYEWIIPNDDEGKVN